MPEKIAPRVSVLMSVYNGERYLRDSIESIANQTFRDYEFVIVDDGSVDNTWGILEEYAAYDARIVLLRNKVNIGLTRSLNKGLASARGGYIARQDADDVSLPERLEKQIEFLEANPETVLVASDVGYIDHENRQLGRSARTGDPDLVAWYLLFYNHLGGHSQVVFRRSAVMDLGGYCEALRYSQDYELWLRLVKVWDIVILPDVLLQWRIHGQNISVTAKSEQRSYSLANSRRGIRELIGEELSLEQVDELREFWLGRFQNSGRVDYVHRALKRIYRAFLQRRSDRTPLQPELPRNLRIIIGKQFLRWVHSLSMRHKLLPRLKVSLYASAWHPMGVAKSWMRDIWNALLRISQSNRASF